MLDAIRGFVTRNILRAPGAAPPTDPRAPSGGIQLAACALLLELAHIESALGRHFGVEPATAAELIALAEAERSQSIDHFQFTRLIAQQYNLGQKMVLAEVMWGVILADGQIAQHEASLVRKLASLLDLEPAYLAQARSAAATTTPSSRSA